MDKPDHSERRAPPGDKRDGLTSDQKSKAWAPRTGQLRVRHRRADLVDRGLALGAVADGHDHAGAGRRQPGERFGEGLRIGLITWLIGAAAQSDA